MDRSEESGNSVRGFSGSGQSGENDGFGGYGQCGESDGFINCG